MGGKIVEAYLLALLDLGSALSASLLLALALLEQSLRDVDLVLGRDGAVVTCGLVRSPQSCNVQRTLSRIQCTRGSAGWRTADRLRHSQRWLTR